MTLTGLLLLLALASAALVPDAPLMPTISDVTNSSAVVGWVAPTFNGAPVDQYELQYRTTSDSEWTVIGGEDIGRKAASVHEVQKIVTRCDPGSAPTDGTFELTLNFNSISDFDKETVAITNFIPFDATAEEVKEALEALENVGVVDVSRGYESTNGHVDGPNEDGGYTWLVTFLYDEEQLEQLPTADIPLLGVHKTSISCEWSGEGSPVAVHEVRQGTKDYAFCTDDCSYSITGLSPATLYTFNLRAHNSYGWGAFSQDTDPVLTLASSPPNRPSAPKRMSSTSSSLNLRIEAPESSLNGDFLSYEAQYRKTSTDQDPSDWVDCDEFTCTYGNSNDGSVLHASNIQLVNTYYVSDFIISDLESATFYDVRVRFTNTFGTGPWSGASSAFMTAVGGPSTPAAPEVMSVTGESASLAWVAPEAHGSNILDYEVQYRKVNSVQEQLWIDEPDPVSGLIGLNRAERQMIRTSAPFGASVVGGEFVLAFIYGGLMDRDPEGKSRTDPIPFNATASEVKAKLEALDNVRKLQRVQRQAYPAVGGGLVYAWTVTFDPEVHTGDVPTFKQVYNTLSTDADGGGGAAVVITEVVAGLAAVPAETLSYEVSGLEPYTNFEFRLRARNAVGYSQWGPSSEVHRTLAVVSEDVALVTHDLSDQKLVTAENEYMAANNDDPDYVFGAGVGGLNSSRGGDGIVVITAYSYGQQLVFSDDQSRQTTFFYAEANGQGTTQTYTVPRSLPGNYKVRSVEIKVWGAGGGGGTAPQAPHNEPLNSGGGGGFAQGVFAVTEGEELTILVGGGGNGFKSGTGASGGYNGGGDGGSGDYGGGGGGGASAVLRASTSETLIIAGGGGGGGVSDYCCAAGGGGGGITGGRGLAPTLTPRDNTGLDPYDDFKDPRDDSGFPPYHQNLDKGYAPDANLTALASAGAGATQSSGGGAGDMVRGSTSICVVCLFFATRGVLCANG